MNIKERLEKAVNTYGKTISEVPTTYEQVERDAVVSILQSLDWNPLDYIIYLAKLIEVAVDALEEKEMCWSHTFVVQTDDAPVIQDGDMFISTEPEVMPSDVVDDVQVVY